MEWVILFGAFGVTLLVAGLVADAVTVWRLDRILKAEDKRTHGEG